MGWNHLYSYLGKGGYFSTFSGGIWLIWGLCRWKKGGKNCTWSSILTICYLGFFQNYFSTRMHSSRMCATHSLTVSCRILCTPPATMHAPWQPCMPPCSHACPQQPCTPPCNHTCSPGNHTCPPATTYAPRNYTCPPATTHAPPQPHTPPLPWTEWHTRVKILPCLKLRLRAVNISSGGSGVRIHIWILPMVQGFPTTILWRSLQAHVFVSVYRK